MSEIIERILDSDAKLRESICNDECDEEDKIKWDSNAGLFYHIRIDGKYITTNTTQKNDCLIFFYNENIYTKIFVFFIETKENNPSIIHAVNQIQQSVNILITKLAPYQNHLIIVPVIYLNSISSINNRILMTLKIKYGRIKLPIVSLKNNTDILETIKNFKH